jgi:hypothetical protein
MFGTAEAAARAFDARAVQLGGTCRKLEHAAGGSGQAFMTAGGNPNSMYAGVGWNSKRGLGEAIVWKAAGRPTVSAGCFGS